jgi:hypothetical protein
MANIHHAPITRNRLPNRRVSETFTISRLPDGRCCELFLNNHKSNSSADNTARDAAIIASIALQYGADVETIRKGLSRDSLGRATSPVGAALDRVSEMEGE